MKSHHLFLFIERRENQPNIAYAFSKWTRFVFLNKFLEQDADILRPICIDVGDWFSGTCCHAKRRSRLNQKTNGILVDKVIRKIPRPLPTSVVDGLVQCIIALEIPHEFDMNATEKMKVDHRLRDCVAVEHNILGWVGMLRTEFQRWRPRRVRCTVRSLPLARLSPSIAPVTIVGFEVINVEREMRPGEVIEDTDQGMMSMSFPLNNKMPRDPEPGTSSEEKEDDDEDLDDDDDDDNDEDAATELPPSYDNEQSPNIDEANQWNPERTSPADSQHSERSLRYVPPPMAQYHDAPPQIVEPPSRSEAARMDLPRPKTQPPSLQRFQPPTREEATFSYSQSPSHDNLPRQDYPPSSQFSAQSQGPSAQPTASLGRNQPTSAPPTGLTNSGYQAPYSMFAPNTKSEIVEAEDGGVVIAKTDSDLMFIYSNQTGPTLIAKESQWMVHLGQWYKFRAQRLMHPLPGCDYVTVEKLGNSADLMPTRELTPIIELETKIERQDQQWNGYDVWYSGDLGNVLVSQDGVPYESGGYLIRNDIQNCCGLVVLVRPWFTRAGKFEWLVSIVRQFVEENIQLEPLHRSRSLASDSGPEFDMVVNDMNLLFSDCHRTPQPPQPPQYSPRRSPQDNYPADTMSGRFSFNDASSVRTATTTLPSTPSIVPTIVDEPEESVDLLFQLWHIESIKSETRARDYNLFNQIENYVRRTSTPALASRPPTSASLNDHSSIYNNSSKSNVSCWPSSSSSRPQSSNTSSSSYYTAQSGSTYGSQQQQRYDYRDNDNQRYSDNQSSSTNQKGFGRFGGPNKY